MRFDTVLFADDFLRTSTNGVVAHPINRRMLRALFGPALRRLGLTPREVCSVDEGGLIPTGEVMKALGLPTDPAGWARAVSCRLGPVPSLEACGRRTLVIGFGLTPAQLVQLSRQGCAVLDVEVHAWRFEPTLTLRVRTNDEALAAVLQAIELPEETAWNAAAGLGAWFARRNPPTVFDPALRVGLFVGQTQVDLSLVRGGVRLRPVDVVTQVAALARDVDVLLVKPHPYEPSPEHLLPLLEAVPNARWCTDNIYALLCCDNLAWVTGLSSGALQEAPFFGKSAHGLLVPDRDDPACLPPGCSRWFRVSPELASGATVARLVGARAPGPAAPLAPDTLSRALGARWGGDSLEQPLSVLPVLEAEQLSFVTGSPELAALGSGWSYAEDWGVWSEGACAVLRWALPSPLGAGEEVEVTLDATLLQLGAHVAQVSLRVAGQPARALSAGAHRLVLQGDQLPGRRFVELVFHVANPASPFELAASGDRLCRLALSAAS